MIVATVVGVVTVLVCAYSCKARISHGQKHFGKMKVVHTDGQGGAGITLLPNDEQYDNVVVWMHGLGDTADGWAQASMSR